MSTLVEDLELLKSTRSTKRRSAAKRLRKLGDPAAGPDLLEALRKEVEDPRTWETQYQLVMALGECRHIDALEFLNEFAARPLDATMIYVGIGDAIVRLKSESPNDGAPIIDIMKSGNEMLIRGAFRGMAMLKMVPSDGDIDQILNFVCRRAQDDPIRFWPLAAAPGWTGDNVSKFVEECIHSSDPQIARAAKLAAAKKYSNWRPL